MINTLQWDKGAVDSLEYIGIVESLYLPDFEEYEYNLTVETFAMSQEEIDEVRNIPFGATSCMVIFKHRYNNNEFIQSLSYSAFIQDYTIKHLIKEFGLDIDKFWLLVLFCLDYCNGLFYQGTAMRPNPMEQLQQLVSSIRNTIEEGMSLSFKVGKSKVSLDDARAIHFIADAVENALKEANYDTLRHLSRRVVDENAKDVADSPIIAFFANMLLRFFNTQPQIKEQRKKGATYSLKELELVSRLVYFTKLSTNKSWLDIENKTLKPFLKQYKNYEYPKMTNSIYPEFFS